MKIYSFYLLLLFFTSGSFAAQVDMSKLIGTWGNSDDGGRTFWGYDKYLPDGVLVSWGTTYGVKYNIEAMYKINRKFKIESCITITKADIGEEFVGESWCDEILELNDEIFKFKSDDGEITTLYRQDL
ncbi:hypothetical protein [Alteromonas sp. S167]|uniref:hypothetical protein n=1 Tax=Alteromonas sp. S167 TaxID=3117402 RepID=UPI002FE0613E